MEIYVTSDTHFNHKKIINYCDRPFKSTGEMNRVLVKNWNSVVNKDDIVLFLGDFAFCYGKANTKYWLDKLNGKKLIIKGNHDRSKSTPYIESFIYKDEFYKIMFIHNPAHVPDSWKGWVVHGHTHNNECRHYPLINPYNKTINVSTEVTNYVPISFNKILDLIDYVEKNDDAI